MENIYQAPSSELIDNKPLEGYGSLERGIAGDYSFSIGATFSEAWAKTKGAKLPIIMALVLMYVCFLVLGAVVGFVMAAAGGGDELSIWAQMSLQLVVGAISIPLTTGIFVMGVRRAAGAPISVGDMFNYLSKALPLLLAYILISFLVGFGILLLVLPGIYLSIAYLLTVPLIADKGLGPWQAMEASRKAITKRWFSAFGFWILIVLINMLGFLLLIGWIWTIPWTVIACGIWYRNTFGCEAATLA